MLKMTPRTENLKLIGVLDMVHNGVGREANKDKVFEQQVRLELYFILVYLIIIVRCILIF